MLRWFKKTKNEKFFSIISSCTIRPEKKFNVAVALHKSNGSCVFNITIKGPLYSESKTVKVNSLTVKCIEFDIPSIKIGDYELIAKGVKGVSFQKYYELRFQECKPIVLIQLDKVVYKPNQLVNFRVILIMENMRPASPTDPVSITIYNNHRIRLKRWKDVRLNKGVFSGSYKLSDRPLFGKWQIRVTVGNENTKSKSFEVVQRKSLKFILTIEVEKNVSIVDGFVNITIRAVSTFGMAVSGKATITISPKHRSRDSNVVSDDKTIDINGKGEVRFDIHENYFVEGKNSNLIEISVVMEDKLTGKKAKSKELFTLHRNRFFFQQISPPYYFRPGNLTTISFAVKTINDLPVTDLVNHVKLSIEHNLHFDPNTDNSGSLSKNVIAELTSNLDKNGIVTFQYVFPQKEYYPSYNLKCEYLEFQSYVASITKYDNIQDNAEYHDPLSVKILTESPDITKDVSIQVTSNDLMSYFFYTLITRGKHLKTELVQLPKASHEHIFSVSPDFDMLPKTVIFIHYIFHNVLKYGNASIIFEKRFENFIDIAAESIVYPGDVLKIKIRSNPHSFIGILGVNENAQLLEYNNDLNSDVIFRRISQYDETISSQPCPGATSGLITITNAHFSIEKTPPAVLPDLSSLVSFSSISEQISSKYMKTWFFDDIENMMGKSVVFQEVPDITTTWMITGFSMHSKFGFAITKSPTIIKTPRPSSINTNLPYSVKLDEHLRIPVFVFNNMDEYVSATVTLDNSADEYDFLEPDANDYQYAKNITIPDNSEETVFFLIRPKVLGIILLKITAVFPLAINGIDKKLLVVADGTTVYKNNEIYLYSEKDGEPISCTVPIDVPENIVHDSLIIEANAMATIFNDSIVNIDGLVLLPCGCGEQVMVNFAPIVFIVQYLEAIEKLTQPIIINAKHYLEIDYQTELTYRHDDGSFSSFGKMDSNGSTWLTAYVVRCFYQARKYIYIDPKILEEGFLFLTRAQRPDGSFHELEPEGKLLYMSDIALTAFVLITFLADSKLLIEHLPTIDRGFQFLQEHLNNTNDVFALSVSAYAFQLRKSNFVYEIIAKLNSLADLEDNFQCWDKGSSHAIQTAGYVVLAMSDMPQTCFPIVRWLISQRNSHGGYNSTQDTVVGMWALTKFAETHITKRQDVYIELRSSDRTDLLKRFSLNVHNQTMMQTVMLENDTREVNFTVKGEGEVVIKISYQYNIREIDIQPSFRLRTTIKPKTSDALFSMNVFVEFMPPNEFEIIQTNMVVMEVSLPSGFTADKKSFYKIGEVENVKHVELTNDATRIVIYFNSLKIADERIIPIEAELSHDVSYQKPASIVVYDYYDVQKRAIAFYQFDSVAERE